MAPGGLPDASRRLSQQNVDVRAILRSKLRPCWDPKNCLKMTESRKKNFQDRFSIAKRRKMMNWDPFQEGVADKYPKKRRFSRIWGRFWTTFSRQVASPSPACGVRKKRSKKHDIPSSLAFGATCKKARKIHKKASFFKNKGLEKGHPQKAPKNLDFRPFWGVQNG